MNGNANGNMNGNMNGNANGNGNNNSNNNGSGPCPDGSLQVEAELAGGRTQGDMEYRQMVDGCKRFRVRIRDFPAFQQFSVYINDVVVGTLFTDDDGRAELEYRTSDGSFPPDFPPVNVGDVGDVGHIATGSLLLDCGGSCS